MTSPLGKSWPRSCWPMLFVLALSCLPGAHAKAFGDAAIRDYTQQILAGEELPHPGLLFSHHPAMPWLEKAWMRPRLAELDDGEVERFISRHRERPFASDFRREWLLALGRAERWQAFRRHYRGERDQALQCLAMQGRLARKDKEQVLNQAAALWLTGRNLPADCDPLFRQARQVGIITDFMVAERYRLALRNDNLALAERLAPDVGTEAVRRVTRLRAIRAQPRTVITAIDPASAPAQDREDLLAAIKRLARRAPREARQSWEQALADGLKTSDREAFLLTRRLALEAARQHLPEAEQWLSESSANDGFIRAWRIRNALRLEDWEAVLAAIDSHPDDDSRQWQYWRARALEQLGRNKAALAIYQRLGRQQDYYGLLASKRTGEIPRPSLRPIEVKPSELDSLSETAELQLARTLLTLDWPQAARQEWRNAVAQRDREGRCQAAVLAAQWAWNSEAVITAARAGCRGDMVVDYPLAFAEWLQPAAEELSLDSAWAWSIMRAESLFMPDARSHVGALGLMQLMPATARDVARELDLPLNGTQDILQPEQNVRLGTGYLRKMLDRFDDHPLVATAAYNAGPHRAESWLPENGHLDGDIWAEIIPFQETRRYIRRVMSHSIGYDLRLDNGEGALAQRLRPVGRTPPQLACNALEPGTTENSSGEGGSKGQDTGIC